MLAIADLHQRHGLTFLPTRKDDKQLAVDELDVMVRRGKLRIHPRCTNLIREMYSTVWNASRTEWERTADGHGDLLDALVYVLRNVRRHRDVRPVRTNIFEDMVTSFERGRKEDELVNAFMTIRRR